MMRNFVDWAPVVLGTGTVLAPHGGTMFLFQRRSLPRRAFLSVVAPFAFTIASLFSPSWALGQSSPLSWTKTSWSLPGHAYGCAMADGSIVAVRDSGSVVYRSTDRGASWQPYGTPIVHNSSLVVQCMGSSPSGGLIVGMTGGAYATLDAGGSWNWKPMGVVNGIAFDSGGNGYAAASDGVYRTHDGGTSWTMLQSLGVTTYAVATSPTGTVFVGCDRGIALSADSGKSWRQSGVATGLHCTHFAIDALGRIFAPVSWNGSIGLLISSNDGKSWEQHDSPTSSAIAAVPGRNLIVNGYLGVMTSSDGGNSWRQELKSSLVGSFFFDRAGFLFAATATGLFRTTSSLTGVDDKRAAALPSLPDVEVHPNPFSSTFAITCGAYDALPTSVSLIDVLGRTIGTWIVSEAQTVHVPGDMPPGAYRVVVRAGSAVSQTLVLKVR
jgi:photosystem II stability/assembly factor-like uncharacterized protein